jgi:hypothetical protein
MKNFNEKTLVQKLDKILRKQFGTNLSFKEFSAGYGIADLVFASDFSFSKRQASKRMPITNFFGLKILLSLEDSKVYSQKEILSIGNSLDRPIILKQLSFLIKNNYVEKISKNEFRKAVRKEDLNPIKKIIAIEVKLADHKSGLLQARRYQYFADESYLAILKEAEKNIDTDEFNRQNIGLILFDQKTNSIEIRYPKKGNEFEGRINLYAKELMLQKFLSLSF